MRRIVGKTRRNRMKESEIRLYRRKHWLTQWRVGEDRKANQVFKIQMERRFVGGRPRITWEDIIGRLIQI